MDICSAMWEKTRGIVIHKIKHTDTAMILRVFTEDFGYKSFMFRGARSKKSKTTALLQSFSPIEFHVNIRDNKNLHQMKDVRSALPVYTINGNIAKSSLLLFMCEVVYKSIEDGYQNDDLFNFLMVAIQTLDKSQKSTNFHIWFLLELSRQYGFYPSDNFNHNTPFFDANTGEYVASGMQDSLIWERSLSEILNQYLGMIFDDIEHLNVKQKDRFALLEGLIDYLRYHLDGMREIKSHEVFKVVFSS